MTDTLVKNSLNAIIDGLCKTRKRHDAILVNCVRDTVANPTSKDPLHDFATHLARRLAKNESVAVNSVTLSALFLNIKGGPPDNVLELLPHYLKRQPPALVLESQPILNLTTKKPILLVISCHAFRVMEITLDISRVLNPDASPEQTAKKDYLANISRVSENILHMGAVYTAFDLIDCLSLIAEKSAFYLRAGLLFNAAIEPKPFVELLEDRGFHVSFLLDDVETNESLQEYDFLRRLQGLLITRSSKEMQRAMDHIDFLQDLTRLLRLPKPLASPLRIG